jgi:tripartite ATP-independent transporter DctP family solute receptor
MARKRPTISRRGLIKASGGLAGILATGQAPVFAQAQPKKMLVVYTTPPPDVPAIGLEWFSKAITERSKGELVAQFEAGTVLTKEVEITNAVKAGNATIGTPIGATASLFPEMGVFITPYLISSYQQAYKTLDGKVGDRLNKVFIDKYKVKPLFYYDLGFRHFFNSKHPINEPADLRGIKIRAHTSKIFADTINALGAVAVPMPFTEVVTAATQGVIDGGDYPTANMAANRFWEISKFYSMTYHNYGASVMLMNLAFWEGLRPDQQTLVQDTAREAQKIIRHGMDSVDSLEGAKKLLEPNGMKVNAGNIEAFKKLAVEKVWPAYKKQYADIWDEIVASSG